MSSPKSDKRHKLSLHNYAWDKIGEDGRVYVWKKISPRQKMSDKFGKRQKTMIAGKGLKLLSFRQSIITNLMGLKSLMALLSAIVERI